jgi:hypothetical protein
MKKENYMKLLKRAIHCPYISKMVKDFRLANKEFDEEFLLTDYILNMSNAIEELQKVAIDMYMKNIVTQMPLFQESHYEN